MRFLYLLIILLALSTPLLAQQIPPGGQAVLPANATTRMYLQSGGIVQRSVVSAMGVPFPTAVQCRTLAAADYSWAAQLGINTSVAIKEGDIMLATFWARGTQSSEETGEVYSEFIFERDGDPYTKSAEYAIVVSNAWRQFFVPFRAVETYAAGQSAVRFRLGYPPQTIQFGGLEVLNYARRIAFEDLPRNSIGYAGMEPDAPWRIEAEQMIDRYRKGDIRVILEDAEGQPIAGREVEVRMTRHAYAFGSAVAAGAITMGGGNGAQYNEIIQTYFNRVVMENDLKWPFWETWNRQTTLTALNRLRDWGIEIRGHNLVWPAWGNLPPDLQANRNNPTYLSQRTLDHIEEETTTLAGRLVDWDVINENYSNHDLMDILGDEVIVDWFVEAHAGDPGAKLYLNDYAIISGGGLDQAHRDHFIETVRFLMGSGAPIHGLGTQCHFGANPTPPQRIWSILDTLDDLGLEIQATEFDIDSDDVEYQVNYMRDFMTAYFAHPSTVGILMWGFWEGQHWRPRAALWDNGWNLRPHGQVWIDLVTQTWWTDETVITDEKGEASLRGFLGDYTLATGARRSRVETAFAHRSDRTTLTLAGSEVDIQHGSPTVDRSALID